ncbi:uracil-DNA glycosylase [Paludibacterium purpuratum]|uniref:Type-4 uracil-DNA glycosylase n=1 Tax=Paludibacterium purpuratum TaxID=1144873 RepID=A0A4R7AXR2_9NEIS|nr:uracil-DNA glycosylase [Paludibacterium purpuratum]TDR71068.1 DNA polymerase [Paludibacterium purpuratum]
MSRKPQIVEALGLGPIWQVRDARLAAHPASSWLQAPAQIEAPAPLPMIECASQEQDMAVAMPSPEPASPPASDFTQQPAPNVAPSSTEQPSWEALESAVRSCQLCRLCNTRTQPVFGRGNRHARWMIVGEAPGEQEDRQGQPFVGRAGKLLDNMLAAAGLSPQDDVFIANVLKCRPPGNRNPAGDEIAACQPYLLQQIAHIQPDIILALGRFAAQTLLQTELSISRLRGKVHDYQGHPLIVSYHPAYLLRNPPDKSKAWQDWVLAKRTLA